MERRFSWVGIVLMALAWGVFVNPQPFHRFLDDFSCYPEGSAGEPQWEVTHIGFEVRQGALWAEVPAEIGYALLRVAPFARTVTVEATLIVHRLLGRDWKIAGIGIFADRRNYWHLALVEAPEHMGRRHFAELAEMLDGVWNAHGEPATHLTTEEDTGGFDWQIGRPYRLRLTLTKEGIIGEIFELDGTLRYRCIRRFDNRAVTFGRPMLDCGGFVAAFDDVQVEVKEVMPLPPKELKTFPPFPSRLRAEGVPRQKAMGFFRTDQINGVWWLVDPNGYPTLSIGTDHVNYFVHWCEKLGYAPYHRNVARKYGSEEAWAKEAVRRLLSWNFNVLGANNSVKARYQGLAHTEFLAFGGDFASIADIVPKVHWTGFPDVFDRRFERFCELRAKERCAPNFYDPWLLGYFLDNELEWWGKSGRPWGMAEEAWKKPSDRACKQALVRILRTFYDDNIAAFNADFGTTFARFDDLLTITEPSQPRTERGKQALMAFVREAAERYFRITAQAIKKHDPNHLNLGCRFAWDAPEPAWEMAGKFCDIVTVNLYPRIDLERGELIGVVEHLQRRYKLCRKPIIITEWSFPALDAKDSEGRPLPCKHGGGMRVETQGQKARCYALFQRTVFSLPFVVGSHYFMWVDEPALGISSTFPEDSNYGLVNEADEPYLELTAMATKVNAQMSALHAGRTAELVAESKGQSIVVRNVGKVAATFTLSVWRNGKRTDQRMTLPPHATRIIRPPRPRSRSLSPRYLRVVCDPDEEVPERNKQDNVAELVVPPTSAPFPNALCAVVWNPTEQPLKAVPVTLTDERLRQWQSVTVRQAREGQWSIVPSQSNPKEASVTVLLPALPPFSAITFWLTPSKQPAAKEFPFAVHHAAKGQGFIIETRRLRLVKDESDGDAFDRIYLRSMEHGAQGEGREAEVELGSFTPLVWQVIAGQNLWVRPDRIERMEVVEIGHARLVVDILFLKEQGVRQAITEVGAGGRYEPLTTEPQPFRCAYRFTFFADQPFFLAQCLWVENTGKVVWRWRGYYHYALSRIGGDARDDEVGGPNVPNYWLSFASWRDPKWQVHYGILPLREDERLGIWFWKDEGGGQHPDCHRRLDIVLKAGEKWQPEEPEPVVAVFGVRETAEDPRPWSTLAKHLRAWAKVQAKVF